MTAYSFGDVILVPFPFTDQSQAKQRTAVVVSSSRYNAERPDLVLVAITSQVRTPSGFGEILVQDWQAARYGSRSLGGVVAADSWVGRLGGMNISSPPGLG